MTPPSHTPEEAFRLLAAWRKSRAAFVAAAIEHLLATRHRQGLPESGPDAERASARAAEQARKEFAWVNPIPLRIYTSGRSDRPERSIGE
jgi:hypothetical protein